MKHNYIFESIDKDKIPKLKKSKGNKNWKDELYKIDKKFRKNENNRRRKARRYNRVPKKYAVYIKSKHWRTRRNKYFQDYGKKCFICGSVEWVVLHHLEYKHNLFGREPDTMLVQLCREHHEEFHTLYGVKQKMYKEFDEFIELKYNETLWN